MQLLPRRLVWNELRGSAAIPVFHAVKGVATRLTARKSPMEWCACAYLDGAEPIKPREVGRADPGRTVPRCVPGVTGRAAKSGPCPQGEEREERMLLCRCVFSGTR